MSIRPILIPALLLVVCGGLVGFLMLAEPPEAPDPASLAARTRPETAISPDAGQPQAGRTAAAPLPADIRDVSPDGVTAPKVQGRLTRVEPSKRYLELKDPPVVPVPDGPLELKQVQVLDGGHLRSGKLTLTLAHIVPLKDDESCLSRLGGDWPCGARARTFLRGLIRRYKITCEKIEDLGPQHILATCTRGPFNLNTRMVRYGWADPAEGAPAEYVRLAGEAREKKIGKWQSEWLDELPEPAFDDTPTADLPTLPGLEDLAPEIVEWSLRTEPDDPGVSEPFPAN